jgi:hypothetical protein
MEVPVPPAVRVTLVRLNDVVGPVGATVADRPTAPAKPKLLVRVIVEVSELPTWIVSVVGLALMLKFGGGVTVRLIVAV